MESTGKVPVQELLRREGRPYKDHGRDYEGRRRKGARS